MTDLFRREALEHHSRAAERPSTLDVPRWSTLGYWALLVLVVLGIVASLVVRVDGERLLSVLLGRG